VITFDVYGLPGPQGSKSFKGMRGGKAVMIESSAKVKPWREAVCWQGRQAMGTLGPLCGPLRASLTFTLPKPQRAPKTRHTWPMKKPDLDKLVRSTFDGMTAAGVWNDDAQAVELTTAKRYPGEGEGALTSPGVRISIEGIA
jgi:Holliday junction resolvase RusA-like endonuclease